MPEKSTANVAERLKKWRACDDVEGLKRRVYRALRIAEEIAYAPETTTSERLKACTVMQQTARTYLKVLEADELEERIEALEEAAATREAKQSASGTPSGNGTYRYN